MGEIKREIESNIRASLPLKAPRPLSTSIPIQRMSKGRVPLAPTTALPTQPHYICLPAHPPSSPISRMVGKFSSHSVCPVGAVSNTMQL